MTVGDTRAREFEKDGRFQISDYSGAEKVDCLRDFSRLQEANCRELRTMERGVLVLFRTPVS